MEHFTAQALQKIHIHWGAWYDNLEKIQLEFPNEWSIHDFSIHNASSIQNKEDLIKNAIINPIGSKTLNLLAKGKSNAVIVIEDISRPSKLEYILKIVIEEIIKGGISNENITIIGALGGHRPMTRFDYIKKCGKEIWEKINIENHHPYENLIHLGTSKAGTPIYINQTYYNAELKIAIGTVLPHPLAGFGGGAKMILPGISGIDTLQGNHEAGLHGVGIGLGFITQLRLDIEDVCHHVGLDFSVNLVSSINRDITGIFAGDFIKAHRKAVEFAKEVYKIELRKYTKDERFDAALYNLYPEDTELTQSIKGFNMYMTSSFILKRKAPIVIMTASSEGRGFHSLSGETGSRLFQKWTENPIFGPLLGKRKLIFFSPNISHSDLFHSYSKQTILCRNFSDVILELNKNLPKSARIALFSTSLGLIQRV
ncbi:MAG: lactate racemase domain-containing protein [Promethearchaeota archaeon]